jgi:GNAT superfamily N-acetyltransferase
MIVREASTADIPQIQIVRHAVKENILSNPALVTDADCETYITQRGKGWVCEINNRIVGFAIADLQDDNIWALFLDPAYEGKGIGRTLHSAMLNWYFEQGKKSVWLSTAPGTRAEQFYHKAGWTATGFTSGGEVKFEMQLKDWQQISEEG